MALAFVESQTANNATGSAVTTAFTTTTVAGQLIVVSYADDSATTTTLTSIADNKGNTYTAADSFRVASVTYRMYYAVVAIGGTGHTITATWSTAAAARATVVAQYFNGFTGTPTLDKAIGTTGSSTTATPGTTAATTAAAEIVVVGAAHASTTSAFSLGTGYTNLGTVSVANAQIAQESKVVAATGTQTGTLNIALSRAWSASIATFKDVVSTTAPVVTTQAISGADSTSATLNGNVTSDGGSAVTARGFVWSTTVNPTTADTIISATGTTGAYTGSLTGRTPNTTYHIRAYATNAIGTSYGADVVFTPRPLIATLTDNFDDGTRGSQWTQYTNGGTISENGSGQLQFVSSTTAGYNGYSTNTIQNYCLIGSTIYIKMVSAGNQSLASMEAYPISLTADANNNVFMMVNAGTIYAFKKVAGTQAQVANIAYNSTNHVWFRIRESGGTVFWETTDVLTNVTWTQVASIATTSVPFVYDVYVDIEEGTFAAEASTTTVLYDNLNVSPGALFTQGLTASVSPAGSFAKQTRRALTAGLTGVGSFAKKTARSISASLSPTGSFAASLNKLMSFTASLTPSATLSGVRLVLRTFTASLSPTGAFSRRINRGLTAAISPAGTVVKSARRAFTASVSPTGAFTKKAIRALTASLSPTGSFVKQARRSFTAGMTSSGSIARRIGRNLTATLTPTGAFSRTLIKFVVLTANLTFVGSVGTLRRMIFVANLTFSGSIVGRWLSGVASNFKPLTITLTSGLRAFTEQGGTRTVTDSNPTNKATLTEPGSIANVGGAGRITTISSNTNKNTLDNPTNKADL